MSTTDSQPGSRVDGRCDKPGCICLSPEEWVELYKAIFADCYHPGVTADTSATLGSTPDLLRRPQKVCIGGTPGSGKSVTLVPQFERLQQESGRPYLKFDFDGQRPQHPHAWDTNHWASFLPETDELQKTRDDCVNKDVHDCLIEMHKWAGRMALMSL